MTSPIEIDAFIDITCPYCFLGKRQLERALADNPDIAVALRWQSLQLSPDTPAEGKPYHQRMAEVIGSEERKNQALAGITESGKELGIAFHFERVERMPNTLLAHCLINWTEGELQDQMVEALLKAYFQQGQFLGDPTILAAIAEQLTGDDTLGNRLADDQAVAEVREIISQNQQLGLGGVPAFVFNRQYLLSGAQPAEQFSQLLHKLGSE